MDAKDITNFILGDSQSKGLSKIPKLVLDKNQKITSKITPELENELNKYKDTCPTQEELTKLLNKRNNIVSQLDDLSKFIKQQQTTVSNLNNSFNTVKTVITNVKRAKKALSLGSKAIPSPPGVPGIISSGISDLGDIVLDQTFTNTGLPKLEKLKSQTDGIQSSLDITLNSISKTTDKLNNLDSLIKKCYPNVNLGPLPNDLKDIINQNSQSKNQSNVIRYRGFTLKIETKKFNERLTQSRAVALNKNRIIEYSTEYSFTLNVKTLIEELKQILDRENYTPNDDINNIDIPEIDTVSILKKQELEQRKLQKEIDSSEFNKKISEFKDQIISIKARILKLETDLNGLKDNNKNKDKRNELKSSITYYKNELTKRQTWLKDREAGLKKIKQEITDINNQLKKLNS